MNYIQKTKIQDLVYSKKLGLGIVCLIAIFFVSFLISLTATEAFLRTLVPQFPQAGSITGVQNVVEAKSVFEPELKPIFGEPVKISIPSQKINLDIVEVGVLEDGAMETPRGWDLAGWYGKSAKPGENKNLIINAHYDRTGGAPAAFYLLKNVKINDTVSVEDSFGRIYKYRVTELSYIDINDPTRLQVLEDISDKSTLTMLTCGGVWLPGEGTYNKRLVVKGELLGYEDIVETSSSSF